MFKPITPYWGQIHQVVGADPAVATKFEMVKMPGWHWRLRALKFRLTSDANAVNRYARINFREDSGMDPFFVTSNTAQAASVFRDYSFICGGSSLDSVSVNDIQVPMPYDLHFPDNFMFEIVIYNIQVGDQLSAISIYYDRWPESTVAPTLP